MFRMDVVDAERRERNAVVDERAFEWRRGWMCIGLQQQLDAVGIKIDPVFAPSSTAIAQQVAAGSTNLTVGSGIVDPIRAIEKGAPIAIWRIDMQAPPYALLAKPAIKSIKELAGKTISIGGAKDITRIYVERMLVPNGVKPSEVDYVFAGATSARLSATSVPRRRASSFQPLLGSFCTFSSQLGSSSWPI